MNDAASPQTTSHPAEQSMSDECRSALNVALADQERRWRAGTPVKVETYLENEPQLRGNPEAALDLIYKEILARSHGGENPGLEEYTGRFPELADHLPPIFEVHRAFELSHANLPPSNAPGESTVHTARSVASTSNPEVPGFEILSTLGRGGMGVVYKARQQSLGRIVALKMILSGADASAEELSRLRREAEVVARLAHPNIVQIHEVGEHNGRPYLSLEFVEGGALDRKLGGTPLPPHEAAQLVETLARAMHHAHLQGVVHRDLKPANILLAAGSIPKITDYGLARLGGGSGQTQSGDILGTPSYMSPEQAAGRNSQIGPATDIYALGATLYELLTGRPPFRADNVLETMRQVLELEPVSPGQLQPGVPRDLATVCLKCLEKSPSKRYASAETLADDLQRFLAGQPILARQTPVWERAVKWARRRPALAALYTVMAGAVLIIGLYNVWLRSALDDANTQRGSAAKASEERRRQLVQVLVADGARQLDEGDWFGALLPLAEAARLDQADANRASIHAIRLNAILRQCPRMVQFWPHQGELRHADFAPGGGAVLTVAGNQAYLWDVSSGKEKTRFSHGEPIRAAALSTDGRRLATATGDRRVQLWDVALGKSLGILPASDGAIARVAFVAGTDHVAVVTHKVVNDIQIQVWDIVAGKAESPELEVETGVLFDIAFSPDGKRAFTAGSKLTIWDILKARPIHEEPNASIVTQARFSPDGQLLAASDVTGAVRVWEASTGKKIATVRHTPPVRDAAFSPDGRFLVTGGLDGAARAWRLADGSFAGELRHGPALTHAVSQVSFSPDGRHNVLVAGADNTARVWAGVRPATPLLRHSDRVTLASFSPDGRLVLTACADGTVRVWDLATNRLSVSPLDEDDRVTNVAFDSDNHRVVTATEDGVARIWDAKAGRPLGLPLVHHFPVRTAEFATDGRIVTTGEDFNGGEGEARVWDTATRKLVFQKATAQKVQGGTANDRGIRRAWFSPDGRYVFACTGNGAGQVWDTTTGQPVTGVLEHKTSINGASFARDGSQLLTNTFAPENSVLLWEAGGRPLAEFYRQLKPDNTAILWELPSAKRLASIGEPGKALSLRHASLVPSGERVILLRDGAAELRDIQQCELIRGFRKSGTKVIHTALSPDCHTVVTISDDRTAQLWNAQSGEMMPTPPQFQHAGQNWQPVFSPDNRLVVLTAPGGVRVWDARTGDPVTPPLLHPADVDSVAFSPDSRQVVTASDQAARLWSLHAEEHDANDLLLLAQFLSCARTNAEDARLVPLSAGELAKLWDTIRPKFPIVFTPAPTDVTAWHAEAARASERNQLWSAALFHLERMTQREPTRADLFDRKGRASVELTRLKEAVADFASATRLGADRPGPWHRQALLQLHLDDREGYRHTCEAMLHRFEADKNSPDIQLVIRACVMSVDGKVDFKRIAALAEFNLATRPRDPNNMLMLGAALFRAGQYDDAIRNLHEAAKTRGKDEPFNDLFLAMSYLRQGDPVKAQTHVQQAARAIAQLPKSGTVGGFPNNRLAWSEQMELQILRNELQVMLKTP